MSEWIEWKGGECPVPSRTPVEVRFRSGGVFKDAASGWRWDHTGQGGDLVAYRIAQEAPSTVLPADLAKNSAPLESHIDLGGPAPALARQEGGDHYKDMKIQPFEYIHANGIGFAEGCIIKYVSRWRAKNGVEDLKKARHFLDLLIEAEVKP